MRFISWVHFLQLNNLPLELSIIYFATDRLQSTFNNPDNSVPQTFLVTVFHELLIWTKPLSIEPSLFKVNPILNLDNPDVRNEIFEIATYWIDQGVDGYRLDAAKHYFDVNEYPIGTQVSRQNIIFLKELKDMI